MGTTGYVVVIGAANMDIHGRSSKQLISRDSNPGSVFSCPGGVGRNIAENLVGLDVETRMLSVVGDDPHGRQLMEHGSKAGINMQFVSRHPEMPTSTYLSLLDENGEMQLAISDMGIMSSLSIDYIQTHETMIKEASVIVVDTNLPGQTLQYILETFSDQPLFVDTVSTAKATKLKGLFASIHTLKPSLKEAETLAAQTTQHPDDLPKLANWFYRQGAKRVFISLGHKGVFFSLDGQQGIAPSTVGQSQYSNGAGDAFISGLVYAWLKQMTNMETVEFALAAAKLTISHAMTNHPGFSVQNILQQITRLDTRAIDDK